MGRACHLGSGDSSGLSELADKGAVIIISIGILLLLSGIIFRVIYPCKTFTGYDLCTEKFETEPPKGE